MVAPSLVDVDDGVVSKLERKLVDPCTSLADKYRVLFSLRNVRGEAAHRALMKALEDPSCLFRHDVAFCLGQRQDPAAVAALAALLRDAQGQHAMVRHEAAEALGAIAGADGESGGGGEAGAAMTTTITPDSSPAQVEAACRALLREHLSDACTEVRETCELALARIEHVERERERRRREKEEQQQNANGNGDAKAATATASAPSFQESPYFSVDPTPALPSTTPLPELEDLLMDPKKPMFERYQALFALRNRGGGDSVAALCRALRECSSALLKHEVAYVLGQMQSAESINALCESLADASEHPMVRHEAAEALGAVATVGGGGGEEADAATKNDEDAAAAAALQKFARDPEPIVAESCAVALDVAARGDEFEYADLGEEGR